MSTRSARVAVGLANVVLIIAAMVALLPKLRADPGDGDCSQTAAANFGWGTPNRAADFTDSSSLAGSPPGAKAYHAVLLLWPDANDTPAGGEVDFMEITDPARQSSEFWLHYGPDDNRESSNIQIDATQWHSWAVEWTPWHIAAYVDGRMWWVTTNVAHFPPRRMHLCMQLDNFGGDTSEGGRMMVDWVRQYWV